MMGLGLRNYAALVIYLFSIGLIFLTLFKDRKYGILYFLPFLPLTFLFVKMHKYPLGKDLLDIILMAIILGWLVQNKEFVKTEINRPLYVFILVTFLALLNGYAYLEEGYIGDIRTQMWKDYMIMPLIFFIVVNNIKKLDEIKKLVFHISVVYLLIAVKFFQDYEDPAYYSDKLKDYFDVFVFFSANHLAAFMVQYVAIFLCLFYYFKNKKYQIYFMITTSLGIYNILFLFSRGAYLAFVVVLSILGVLKDRRVLASLVILIMFWNYILPASIFQRINMSINAEDEMGGVSKGRKVMWEHATNLFKDKPLFGIGYRTFEYTIPEDLKIDFMENLGRGLKDTHSVYFNTMAEMGIIGLGLLLFLYFMAARSGWRLFRTARDSFLKGLGLGFVLSVIANMITNAFGDHWSPYSIQGYYWIFWGLTERGLIITKEHLNTSLVTDSKFNAISGRGS